MAPDLVALACPRCSAGQRPGAPWCTQCFLDLRVPGPVPEPPPVAAGAPPDPGVLPTWPCTACATPNTLGDDACRACGLGFLGGLREGEPALLVLPVVGDLAALPRGRRLALALAFVVAVLTFVALLVYLVS